MLIPSLTRRYAGRCEISFPSKTIDPLSERNRPVMTLNSVDLPAPFGPIKHRSSPSRTLRDTSEIAAIPPNDLEMLRASSSARLPPRAAADTCATSAADAADPSKAAAEERVEGVSAVTR